MAFTEDFSQFFDLTGHAVEAEVKTAAGARVGTITVILDTPIEPVALFEADVEASQPSALAKTSDVVALAIRHKFTLTVGGTIYTIVAREDDGTGVSTLKLRKS